MRRQGPPATRTEQTHGAMAHGLMAGKSPIGRIRGRRIYVKMVIFKREREFRSSYAIPRREKFPYCTCRAVPFDWHTVANLGQEDRRALRSRRRRRRQEKARMAICFYSNFPSVYIYTHILGHLHWGCAACAHSKPGATGK